jgi:hypothetical protein
MVIGKVAIEGSLAMLVESIPPINTITGEADITSGCAINNNQIFLGKTNTRDNTKALNANNAIVMIIFEYIVLDRQAHLKKKISRMNI